MCSTPLDENRAIAQVCAFFFAENRVNERYRDFATVSGEGANKAPVPEKASDSRRYLGLLSK
jgi:hypothetical protein